ncbi:MAG TPA: Gfo/Idh/MocA family oxidoreductase [bacterium]
MNIAIIGCGSIAATHLAASKKVRPDAKILLMDTQRPAADSLARQFDVAGIYDNLDQLLKELPDAAHILTPPSTHFLIAERVLAAGCHVLLEKPATETGQECERLCEIASRHNKLMAVDYSVLGMPVVRKALRAVQSGEFGRLIALHCDFSCSWPGNTIPYANPKHWAYNLPGGVLQNMADHPASLVLAAMTPILEYKVAFSTCNLLPNDNPDLLHVMLRSVDQIGSFTLSLGHGSSERRACFLCEDATIVIDMGRQLFACLKGRGPQNAIKKMLSGIQEGSAFTFGTLANVLRVLTGRMRRDPGIMNIIANFYNAISGQEQLWIVPETALAVTSLLEKIWLEIGVAKEPGAMARFDYAHPGRAAMPEEHR